jgi:hypothetical protein
MRRDGSHWPRPWGSSSGPLACGCLSVLLLLVLPRTASAQTGSQLPPQSLLQRIESLQSKERLLVQRLTERTQQVKGLEERLQQAKQKSDDSEASSAELEKQLAEARSSRDSLQRELTETLSLLDQLRQTQTRSEAGFEQYRQQMQGQVRELQGERDLNEYLAWTATGAALGAMAGGIAHGGTTALLGAAGGAATGFLARAVGQITHLY